MLYYKLVKRFNFYVYRMKKRGVCSPTKSSYEKTLLYTIYVIGMIVSNSSVKSSPWWDTQAAATGVYQNNCNFRTIRTHVLPMMTQLFSISHSMRVILTCTRSSPLQFEYVHIQTVSNSMYLRFVR